jgi:hypothetical protein
VGDDMPGLSGGSLRRGMQAFGRFWWDFLVGDTPELLVGAVVGVALTSLLCIDHRLHTVAGLLLTLWVIGMLGLSLLRAKKREERKGSGTTGGGPPDRR